MTFSELKSKDVINIKDCKRLGRVSDLEFDACNGCIQSVLIPGGGKLASFLHCEPEIIIPFHDIRQIGPDIILVDIKL
ncbi:MAG: YlmC/YmxH family sporulation protein [Lachnospiraceae bacterium]|jgi:YlmC/YmxH family sporulation protein|nr:YlmC/YmxH family sporulation protein [Lachnospiraceae bacterium]